MFTLNLLFIITLWRVILFAVAHSAQYILLFSQSFPYASRFLTPSQLPQWIWGFANFDGVHYLSIAYHGYEAKYIQAFFPLFPIIIRWFSWVVGDEHTLLSGFFITFIFFYVFLIVFDKLLELDFYKVVRLRIISWVLVFPTAFFFVALYTESLFSLLVIGAFLAARKKKWWVSGFFGALAAATKITGIFLIFPLLYEWIQIKKNVHPKKSIRYLFTSLFKSPILYTVPLGLLGYMVYLQINFNDALYFWHAQPLFGAGRSGTTIVLLPQVIWRYLKILLTADFGKMGYWTAVFEVTFFILTCSLLLYARKLKVRFSYLLFAWLVVLLPTLSGSLSSMPRYVLQAFPVFITLGLGLNTKYSLIFQAISAIFLIVFLAQFISGIWVA